MDPRLLELGEMIQAAIIGEPLEDVVDIIAQTARASADAEPDPAKRQRLRWYATQLMRLRAGPPDGTRRAARPTGAAAVQVALERLMLRVNRMRDLETLPADDIVWLDTLGDSLTQLVARLPDRRRPTCRNFQPDHNGECLNCDEWADAHDPPEGEEGVTRP